MEITILEVYEQAKLLRVKVETPYGIDNLGLGLHTKYLDPETDEPKWKSEVKKLLEQKYGDLDNRSKKPLIEAEIDLNKPIQLDNLSTKKIK